MENRRTLLLIDEAHDDRHLLAIRLEGLGFKVLEAESLGQIQSVLRHGTVDLVVSEWILPGLGGDLLLQLLDPLQRTVILFTDREIPNLPYFLNRSGVKTVISKHKRSELLQLVSQMKDSSAITPRRPAVFGKRLLLAEDSPTVRHFIRRAIEAQHPDWALSEA
jgi:CheY-like chemotaxis protein